MCEIRVICISLERPHAHAVDSVLRRGGRAAGVGPEVGVSLILNWFFKRNSFNKIITVSIHQPECGPNNAAVMPEEECQENEEVPPLVGVADNVHEAREEPKISIDGF